MKQSIVDLAKIFGKTGRLLADFVNTLRTLGGQDVHLLLLLEDEEERTALARYIVERARMILPKILQSGIGIDLTSRDGVGANPVSVLLEEWGSDLGGQSSRLHELGLQPPALPFQSHLCHASIRGPITIERLLKILKLLNCRTANLWEVQAAISKGVSLVGTTLVLGSTGKNAKGKEAVTVLVTVKMPDDASVTKLQLWNTSDNVGPGENCHFFFEAPDDETIRLLSR